MNPEATNAPVRVFISYAWEDDEYRDRVAQLAAQLRYDGIEARLDRWHLEKGQTIPEFMNSEVRRADKVLILCSPQYQKKVHAMEEGGSSTGSGWESMLLSTAMFTGDARHKAVTALALGKWEASAPSYLQGLPYDDLTHTDDTLLRQAYLSLLRRLTDTTEAAPPVRSWNVPAPETAPPLLGPHRLDPLATDRRILPPVVTLPPRHRMPYRSLGHRFAGRVQALWDLHDLLHQGGTAVVEGVGVVIGTGGLGKTQLAIEYVHRFGNYYPGGVFWTDADQGLATVVQQIGASAHIAIDGTLPVDQQGETLWQSLWQTLAPVLIVFDNFSETQPLEPWLPVGSHLKALVTTRRRDLTYRKISLPFLTPEEGLELLNSGERTFGAEALPLIEALGGLPLALELAGHFLNRRPTLDIQTLLAEIDTLGDLAVLNEFADHYKNELPSGHEKAVGATIQLSWDLASEADQKLLKLMGVWAPSPVPRRLLRRAAGAPSDSPLTDPVNKGIDALERISLVELDDDYDPQIHRLVRGFVREHTQGDEEETKRQAVEAVKTELARTQTDTDTAALTELEKVVPHAQMVLETRVAEPEDAIDIAASISWHQQKRGRFQLAKAAGQQALALAKHTYAPGHPQIAICQSYLGLVLRDLGDFGGAKTLLTEALQSVEHTYEPGHPTIASTQSNLAGVLQALGEFEKAKTLITAALHSDEHTYEPGHPTIARTQSNLALVLQLLGEFEEAKSLLTKALQSVEHTYEPGHPTIASTQSNLGLVLRDLGEFEEAKTLITAALHSDEHTYEPGHPTIARTQSNLALVLQLLGEFEEAKTLLTKALQAEKHTYEPGHPTIATTQSNLALVLADLGELEGAKTLLIQSYEAFKHQLGKDHPITSRVKGNLETVESEIKKDT